MRQYMYLYLFVFFAVCFDFDVCCIHMLLSWKYWTATTTTKWMRSMRFVYVLLHFDFIRCICVQYIDIRVWTDFSFVSKIPVNWRKLQRRSYTFCHERLEQNDETMNISQNIDYYDDDNVHMSIRIKTQHQNFTTQKHIFTSTHSHTHAHSWKFYTIAHMNKTYVYSSRGIHNRSRSSSSRRKIVVIYATACVSECEWVCVCIHKARESVNRYMRRTDQHRKVHLCCWFYFSVWRSIVWSGLCSALSSCLILYFIQKPSFVQHPFIMCSNNMCWNLVLSSLSVDVVVIVVAFLICSFLFLVAAAECGWTQNIALSHTQTLSACDK